MQLLDHASITVKSLAAVKPFYRAIMHVLGAELVYDEADAIGFGERNTALSDRHSYLSIFESEHASVDPRRHWCFRASSIFQVDEFHALGLSRGGSDAGLPGLRDYHAGYYAAFLFDPEGNKVEAVFHCVK